MDPTIIAAIAGVLGVVLGAVIGGVFALKATKRQIEVMMISESPPQRAYLIRDPSRISSADGKAHGRERCRNQSGALGIGIYY